MADAERRHVPLKAADPAAVSLTEDVPPAESPVSAIDQVPEATRITALLVVYGIVIVFWMVFHQNGSTMTYWADENTAWNVSGVVSNAINPFWIVALSIPLVNVWNWLRKRGLEPSTPAKMALGMLLTSLAFLILFVAAKSGGDQTFVTDAQGQFVLDDQGELKAIQNRVSPLWLIAAYMVISLGELMLSPMGLSLVSKVAPSRMRGLMMGGWFVATAIGNKLTVIGVLWTKWYHSSFWLLCSLLALGMALRSAPAHAAAQEGHAGRLKPNFDGFFILPGTTIMRLLLAFLIMIISEPLRSWAAGRPMTVDDLLAVKGVSDPQLSPDGSLVVYVVSELDRATDKNNSSLWLVPSAGGQPKQLTTAPGTNNHPRWSPDGKTIAFVSHRGGSAQVWLLPIDGGEPRQFTKLPIDVSGPIWSPKGDKIAFTAEVYPGQTPEQTAAKDKEKEASKNKVRIYDRLMIRHWNAWDEGKRSHLFVADAQTGEAKDLTPKLEVNTPPAPFGGSSDYAWSPDGKELAFTAEPAQDAAWSTNTDIWTVPVDGGEPKNITAGNQGADAQPAYSPDGDWLAYVSQARAGSSRTSGCSRSSAEQANASYRADEVARSPRPVVLLGVQAQRTCRDHRRHGDRADHCGRTRRRDGRRLGDRRASHAVPAAGHRRSPGRH